jgi:hypothetical protein
VTDPAESPIDGQAFLLASAKASVGPERLHDLLAQVQADLAERHETYRREYECVAESDERAVYLVPADHWTEVGARLGFGRRAADAVGRAHAEQLRRIGSETGRRSEFDAALEIRAAVVVGR